MGAKIEQLPPQIQDAVAGWLGLAERYNRQAEVYVAAGMRPYAEVTVRQPRHQTSRITIMIELGSQTRVRQQADQWWQAGGQVKSRKLPLSKARELIADWDSDLR